jgi:hypothetical protein
MKRWLIHLYFNIVLLSIKIDPIWSVIFCANSLGFLVLCSWLLLSLLMLNQVSLSSRLSLFMSSRAYDPILLLSIGNNRPVTAGLCQENRPVSQAKLVSVQIFSKVEFQPIFIPFFLFSQFSAKPALTSFWQNSRFYLK